MQLPYASDLITQYLPWYFITAKYLALHQIPHWVPNIYNTGYPLFAEGQTGAISPINAVLLFILPFPVAVNLLYIVYSLIALLGVFFFLKNRMLSTPACLLSGLTFLLSGFFLSRYFQPDIIFSSSLIPWGFFLIDKMRKNKGVFIFFPILIYLQITAGHLQMTAISICGYLLFTTISSFLEKYSLSFVFKILTLCLLGLTLSAPQILPSLKLFQISERKDWNPNIRFSYSLPPTHLITYILPSAYGISKPGDDMGFRQFGGGFWEINLTIWTLPFFLSLVPMFYKKSFKNPLILNLYLIWFIFLLTAFGGFFKPYRWFVNSIPNFPFRAPARFLLVSTFAASALVGLGFETIFQRTKNKIKYMFFGIVVISILLQAYSQMKNYFIFTPYQKIVTNLTDISTYKLTTAMPLSKYLNPHAFYDHDINVFREEFEKGLALSAIAILILLIWFKKENEPKLKP